MGRRQRKQAGDPTTYAYDYSGGLRGSPEGSEWLDDGLVGDNSDLNSEGGGQPARRRSTLRTRKRPVPAAAAVPSIGALPFAFSTPQPPAAEGCSCLLLEPLVDLAASPRATAAATALAGTGAFGSPLPAGCATAVPQKPDGLEILSHAAGQDGSNTEHSSAAQEEQTSPAKRRAVEHVEANALTVTPRRTMPSPTGGRGGPTQIPTMATL